MNFKDLLTPSIVYKDRLKKSYLEKPIIYNINIVDNKPLITFNCKSYIIEFQFIGEQFNLNNELKVYCTCPSFNFEFAHILNDANALLKPEQFKQSIQKTPKQKNKYNIIGGCKHCIACARLTFKKFDLIQNKVNNLKKIN